MLQASSGATEGAEFRITPVASGAYSYGYALAAAAIGALGFWLCDDAFISFRYARHLAEGHGLVFNLGESPPIEGFSNLLWVLVLALFELIGMASPLVAPVLSIAAFAWLAKQLSTDLVAICSLSRARVLVVMAAFLSMPPMIVWATSGLETMAFAFALYQIGRGLVGIGSSRSLLFWSACAIALRVDGAVYVAAFLSVGLISNWLWPAALTKKRLLLLLLSAGVAVLTILIFRQFYFGFWSPHTARVKVDPSLIVFDRGFRYVLSMMIGIPGLLLLTSVGSWHGLSRLIRSKSDQERATVALFGTPLLVAILLSIVAGGDFMVFARFFVPVIPFFALLFGMALARAQGGLRSPKFAIAFGLLLVSNGAALADRLPVPTAVQDQIHFRWNGIVYRSEALAWKGMKDRAERWVALGRALGEHTQPGETYVRGAIGAVGYYSELFLLDPYGLVDREVGAGKGNPASHSPGHDKRVPDTFFLSRSPDYFTFTDLVPNSDRKQGIPTEFLDQQFANGPFQLEFYPVSGLNGVVLRLVRYSPDARSDQ